MVRPVAVRLRNVAGALDWYLASHILQGPCPEYATTTHLWTDFYSNGSFFSAIGDLPSLKVRLN
jgi:hypothetical protein